MPEARSHYHFGLIVMLCSVTAWSTAGLFTRFLTVDTLTVIFWRSVFGAIGLAVIVAFSPDGLASMKRLKWPGTAYAAVTAISMFFYVGGLMNTSIAHAAVVIATVPFIAAYLAWMFLGETPRLLAVAFSFLAVIGVGVMMGISREGHLLGDGLTFLAATCVAAMIVISRRFSDIPAMPATLLSAMFCAACALPFANLHVSAEQLGVLALFGLSNQVLGFGLFAVASRYLPPLETGLITALNAPLQPFWVWLVLSETPSLATLAGGGLVLIAVFANILLQHRHTASATGAPRPAT